MTHRLSLLRRVGELRRTYTGETDSTLLPTIAAGISSLTTEDRTTITEVLGSGFETRLLGENSGPPVGDRIRRAVMADTTDPAQQQLEAGILFALGRIAPYQWPATTVVAPMPVCVMTRPVIEDTHTVLHLRAASAAPMIATLLPHIVDNRVHGLAGLRVRLCRRHVRLHLVDSDEPVSVGLANTSFRQWSAMLAFARVLTGHQWPPAFEGPLTGPERALIAAGRVAGPVALASAVLRRLRVLGNTVWLTVGEDGPGGVCVDWAGGRTAAQVATALVHPLAGLPGEQFIVTRAADGTITITAMGAAGASTTRVVLRRASLTAPPPFTRVDATAAWAEFDRVMTLPKPGLPAA